MVDGKSDSKRPDYQLLALVPACLLIFVSVMIAPAAADGSGLWLASGRLVMPNAEPVKTSFCPVWIDAVCGLSRADFGESVAVDAGTAVVGEPNEPAVHIYGNSAGVWLLEESLTGPAGFGQAVALADDTLVVGAPGASEAQVLHRVGEGNWELAAVLTTEGAACLGRAVAIEDGRIAVGDPCASRISVFDLTGGDWVHRTDLTIGGISVLGRGVSVADGTVFGASAGGTYAFSESGPGWQRETVTTTSTTAVAAAGSSVAVVARGDVLVYGKESDWTQVAEIEPQSLSPFEGSGRFSPAIAFNGDVLVVGVRQDDASPGGPASPEHTPDPCVSELGFLVCVPPRPGAAYVFERSDDDWNQVAKLTAEGIGEHRFGTSVGLSRDGTETIVGSPGNLVWSLGSALDVDPEDSAHVYSRLEGEI